MVCYCGMYLIANHPGLRFIPKHCRKIALCVKLSSVSSGLFVYVRSSNGFNAYLNCWERYEDMTDHRSFTHIAVIHTTRCVYNCDDQSYLQVLAHFL